MNKKRRVGVYGGTFNPPHTAHVKAAESFKRLLSLDELIIIPSNLPPHKEFMGNVTPAERLEMTRLAFRDLECTTVSDMEIKRGGKSYTVDTLSAIASREIELFFLCGTDMFLTFDKWYMPQKIFNLATVCYVRRESDPETAVELLSKEKEYKERFNARVIALDVDVIEISSTEIRSALASGKDTPLIPKPVLDYIVSGGLYR